MSDADPNCLSSLFETEHCAIRRQQRNISDTDLQFILDYGKRQRRAGVVFCQFRAESIPIDQRRDADITRLEGATVVLCKAGRCVITVYRNRAAFRKDQKKAKYDNRPEAYALCQWCQLSAAGD
jgi:hypothetical protein